MLFNSVFFITVFLPLSLFGWYLLQRLENPGFAKAFLTVMSFWFYGYYNVNYLWILLCSLAFNYGISFLMRRSERAEGIWRADKAGEADRAKDAWAADKALEAGNAAQSATPGTGKLRKLLLGAGIAGNLGLLFYFKYFNFFIDNCNFFFHTDIRLEKIALPLGISFFTFQQLSFVIERYRGNAPHYHVLDYAFFISFFPQLVAGPIVLHSELVPQLQERKHRRFSAGLFYDGFTLFILGLAKKVLLADSLAVLVNAEFENIQALDSPSAWLVICWFTMELYFDFSGYSDMARGLARMFGLELPVNFDSPFKAVSMREFWKRWHMTLTRFLTQYIYIPLGGSRRGRTRQCVNVLIVFLASGLWHGADWTFVIWGLINGLALVFEIAFPKLRFPGKWINRIITFVTYAISLVFFRSDTLEEALLFLRKMFTAGNRGMLAGVCNMLQYPENYAVLKLLDLRLPQLVNPFFVICMCLISAICIRLLYGSTAEQWIRDKGHSVRGSFVLATLFVWVFVSLSQVSVFLYFNF